MLPPLCISAGTDLQRCFDAARVATPSVHRWVVFENFRHDRMARWIYAGERGMDARNAESPEPFNQQYDFNLAGGGDGSAEWSAGLSGGDARGIHSPARVVAGRAERHSGSALPATRRRLLRFSGCARML